MSVGISNHTKNNNIRFVAYRESKVNCFVAVKKKVENPWLGLMKKIPPNVSESDCSSDASQQKRGPVAPGFAVVGFTHSSSKVFHRKVFFLQIMFVGLFCFANH